METSFEQDLRRNLQDLEYRLGFGEESAKLEVALMLCRARRAASVTQIELARRLGISQTYVARLERGDANPSIGKVGRVLAALSLRLVPQYASIIQWDEAIVDNDTRDAEITPIGSTVGIRINDAAVGSK